MLQILLNERHVIAFCPLHQIGRVLKRVISTLQTWLCLDAGHQIFHKGTEHVRKRVWSII